MKQYDSKQPWLEDKYSLKWDGEWHITIEVFRDLGLAFGTVMIIIYVMIVGWFRSFITPIVIMAPIPLSLVGILPAHALIVITSYSIHYTKLYDKKEPENGKKCVDSQA